MVKVKFRFSYSLMVTQPRSTTVVRLKSKSQRASVTSEDISQAVKDAWALAMKKAWSRCIPVAATYIEAVDVTVVKMDITSFSIEGANDD